MAYREGFCFIKLSLSGWVGITFYQCLHMELKENQSILILEQDEEGDISVNVASGSHGSLTFNICAAIAKKLMEDPVFQEDIMAMIESEDDEQ